VQAGGENGRPEELHSRVQRGQAAEVVEGFVWGLGLWCWAQPGGHAHRV